MHVTIAFHQLLPLFSDPALALLVSQIYKVFDSSLHSSHKCTLTYQAPVDYIRHEILMMLSDNNLSQP